MPEIPEAERRLHCKFLYLAGLEVRAGTPVPDGMECWVILAATHARFVHRGPIHRIGETMGAIYGGWLPKSGYLPGSTPELERYDSRFKGDTPDSELEILVSAVTA